MAAKVLPSLNSGGVTNEGVVYIGGICKLFWMLATLGGLGVGNLVMPVGGSVVVTWRGCGSLVGVCVCKLYR